jgi:hypothetical protein
VRYVLATIAAAAIGYLLYQGGVPSEVIYVVRSIVRHSLAYGVLLGP